MPELGYNARVFHFHQLIGVLGALDDLLASQLHQAQLGEHTFAVHHSNFASVSAFPLFK
jgi:hypothetical protein